MGTATCDIAPPADAGPARMDGGPVPPVVRPESFTAEAAALMLSQTQEGQTTLNRLDELPVEAASRTLDAIYWSGFRFGFREAFRK